MTNRCQLQFIGSARESIKTFILRGFLKGTYFRSAGRPNNTFSPEWPINRGLAVEMALRGRNNGTSATTALPALGAWKPAKHAGFHIPTATATAAVTLTKLLNPRKSHVFTDSRAEPIHQSRRECPKSVLVGFLDFQSNAGGARHERHSLSSRG